MNPTAPQPAHTPRPPSFAGWVMRWAIPILCVGFVAWMAVPKTGEAAFQRVPVGGGRMPQWTMPDLEGRPVFSKQFEGKVVLLNFWATWCPPCVREIPDLNQFYQDHAAEGFVIVGASVESTEGKTVAEFVRRRKIAYPVLLADDSVQGLFGAIPSNPMMPGGLPLPTTYVVARDGRYIAHYLGALNRAELDRVILPLLRAPASTNAVQGR